MNVRLCQRIRALAVGGAALLWMYGCSTEKNAAINVGFHNMNARYNGYFNARTILAEAMANYRNNTKEDYTDILPLLAFPSEEEVPQLKSSCEDAFKRCETVIAKHSMPNPEKVRPKNTEYCRWIDDNWFILAKIHYTMREYDKAIALFDFIQKSPMYVDQERSYEARIWLAKTHLTVGDFSEAKHYLSMVETAAQNSEDQAAAPKQKLSKRERERERKRAKRDRKKGVKKPIPFPKSLKDEYELAMAEYFIALEEYDKATEHLERGCEWTKRRKERTRYQFILGQLYRRSGEGDRAVYWFNRVIRSSAPYEMRFQAKIKKAIAAPAGGLGIREELTKMIRDLKNVAYRDQIYYALGEVALKEGKVEEAKQHYSSSAFLSVNNDRQKGVSYLKLGDLCFGEKDYLAAQKYYDSCVQVLPQTYEGYESVKGKAESLSGLVEHYETYTYEDSVQRKALLPPDELEKALKQQIKDLAAERKRKKEEEQKRLIAQQNRVKTLGLANGSGSKWYFYNQKISSGGLDEFRSLWGQRSLEDNWRRSNKIASSAAGEEGDTTLQKAVDGQEEEEVTVEALRAGLPLTDEAMDSSNHRLMNALYLLGVIYKESLKEEQEAIAYFNRLVDRNVAHPKVLLALYQLYLIHSKNGNQEAAALKETILSTYPQSEVAKIISDPDYLENRARAGEAALKAYTATLEEYRYQRYSRVLEQCDDIIAKDTANPYIQKYYLMKALALARVDPGNTAAIKSTLDTLYQRSPDTEEGKEAKRYLDQIAAGSPSPTAESTVSSSVYTYREDSEHYFVVVIPSDAAQINKPKSRLSNFNTTFFRRVQLQITTAQLGEDHQLLIVKSFPLLKQANDYQTAYRDPSAKTAIGTMAADFETFLIDKDNLSTLLRSNDLSGYAEFHTAHYAN